MPRHIAESAREFHAPGRVLGIKCVGIFDEDVRVEQFLGILFRIRRRWRSPAEVNHLLIPRDGGINRRVLPGAHTFKTELQLLVSERRGDIQSKEERRNLANHQSPTLSRNVAEGTKNKFPVTARL
jgi:hypothetical protein